MELWPATVELLLLLLQDTLSDAENQCYSCMSYIYGANWEYLDYRDIYYTPAYFSDHCANTSQRSAVNGKVRCPNNCVLIVETLRIGARGHKGYIRGCYDSIFRHGFNENYQVIRGLKFRKYCVRLNMSMVMARKEKPPDTEVEVCSCSELICNGNSASVLTMFPTTLAVSLCAFAFQRHLLVTEP